MKPRTFNSLMPFNNEKWAAEVLGIDINPVRGPDLINDNKIVEVKFALANSKKSSLSWRVLGYQKDYGRGREAYWGLGTYQLSQPISSIKKHSSEELENLVTQRTLYLVNWEWMDQFPTYFESGETKISKWAEYIIFPKEKSLPKVIKEAEVSGGKVLFTEGVNPNRFNLTQSL